MIYYCYSHIVSILKSYTIELFLFFIIFFHIDGIIGNNESVVTAFTNSGVIDFLRELFTTENDMKTLVCPLS